MNGNTVFSCVTKFILLIEVHFLQLSQARRQSWHTPQVFAERIQIRWLIAHTFPPFWHILVNIGPFENVKYTFLFPYPFEKRKGNIVIMKNAGSIFRSKRLADSGSLTTWPPTKICHDPPVLGHIPEIGTSRERNPCGTRGGGGER
jgi:hypothetical protein